VDAGEGSRAGAGAGAGGGGWRGVRGPGLGRGGGRGRGPGQSAHPAHPARLVQLGAELVKGRRMVLAPAPALGRRWCGSGRWGPSPQGDAPGPQR
jgi:hypothetical protein